MFRVFENVRAHSQNNDTPTDSLGLSPPSESTTFADAPLRLHALSSPSTTNQLPEKHTPALFRLRCISSGIPTNNNLRFSLISSEESSADDVCSVTSFQRLLDAKLPQCSEDPTPSLEKPRKPLSPPPHPSSPLSIPIISAPEVTLDSRVGSVLEEMITKATENKGGVCIDERDNSLAFVGPSRLFAVPFFSTSELVSEQPLTHPIGQVSADCRDELRDVALGGASSHPFRKIHSPLCSVRLNHRSGTISDQKDAQSRVFETASEIGGQPRDQICLDLGDTSFLAVQSCDDLLDLCKAPVNSSELKGRDGKISGLGESESNPSLVPGCSRVPGDPGVEKLRHEGDRKKSCFQGETTKACYAESIRRGQYADGNATKGAPILKPSTSNLSHKSLRHNHRHSVNVHSINHPLRKKRHATPRRKFFEISKSPQCRSEKETCSEVSLLNNAQPERTSTREHVEFPVKQSLSELKGLDESLRTVGKVDAHQNFDGNTTRFSLKRASVDKKLLDFTRTIEARGSYQAEDFIAFRLDTKPHVPSANVNLCEVSEHFPSTSSISQSQGADKRTLSERGKIDDNPNKSLLCSKPHMPHVGDVTNKISHKPDLKELFFKNSQRTSTTNGICAAENSAGHFPRGCEGSLDGKSLSVICRDAINGRVQAHKLRRNGDSLSAEDIKEATSIATKCAEALMCETIMASFLEKQNESTGEPHPKRRKLENNVKKQPGLPRMAAITGRNTIVRSQGFSAVTAILESAIEAAVRKDVEVKGKVMKVTLESPLETRLPSLNVENNDASEPKRTHGQKISTLQELSDATSSPGKCPYQTRVFTWDCERRVRSLDSFSIHDITKKVMEDTSGKTFVYDGQDFNFNELLSLQISKILESDQRMWALRIDCRDTSKVRMWDTRMCNVLSYRQCPTISSLASFLHDHPWLRVFHPVYVQKSLEENRMETVSGRNKSDGILSDGQLRPQKESRVERNRRDKATHSVKRVLNRIRWNGTTDLQETCLKNISLWNCTTEKVEEPKDFSRRAALTTYLLRNSHLRLLQHQEKLQAFERRTAFHFVPIYLHCPIKLTFLWDMIRQKRKFLPCESDFPPGTTLRDIVGPFSSTMIYAGQDLIEAPFLKEVLRSKASRGCIPWRHMLANCGMRVQREIYDKGWVPHYIDSKLWLCSQAVYWDTDARCVREGCDQQNCQSVKEHIELRRNATQIYLGQDLGVETRNDLESWFNLLRFKPGFALSNNTATLLRPRMILVIDSKITGQTSFESCGKRRRIEYGHKVEDSYGKLKLLKGGEIDHSNEARFEVIKATDLSIVQNGRTENKFFTPPKALHTPVQPIRLEQSGDFCGKPRTRAESGRPRVYSRSAQGDELDGIGMDTWKEIEVLPKVSGPKLLELGLARKKIARLLGSIREAGPKVFRGELTRDLRQELREELVHHFESIKGLETFLARVEKVDFPCMAWELCERIEGMEAWHSFRSSSEASLGPPSLTALSRDILKGRICLATEVFSRFQQMCHQYIIYYGESLVGSGALEVLEYGRDVFNAFSMEYQQPLDLEAKIIKVGEICEAANKVGFLKLVRKRKAKLTLKTSVKVSIRVAGREPMVTFMNCRDEKGHAVMGKQQSVRILGLPIDVRECERRIGQIRKCHICNGEVREGSGGFLKCSNWVFHFCDEVVCRICAEQVLSIDLNEFCRLREHERWFCPHCQGICSLDSLCRVRKKGVQQGNQGERIVRLWWRNLSWEPRFVRMNVMRRSLSGAFHNSDTRTIELLQNREDRDLWERTVQLPTGAYRCGVFINEVEVASTCFQVYQVKTGTVDNNENSQVCGEKMVGRSEVTRVTKIRSSDGEGLGENFIRFQSKRPRQRITWEMSPNAFIHEANVKSWKSQAISGKDEGREIENCSRTEGYDWRRAKYHPVQMWIPHVVGGMNEDGANVVEEVVYCTNEWMWRGWYERGRPEVSNGMALWESCVKWNTYMYGLMLKKLWGIVAGRSEIHGIGLYTLTGYERGEMVIEYAGDLIRTPLGDVREGEYQNAGLGTYLFKLNDDQIVDATVNSNRARFTNHSCDPNMKADVITIAGRELVVLRATRRIPRYAELTFDYQLPYEDDEKLNCLCNSANCVGVMN